MMNVSLPLPESEVSVKLARVAESDPHRVTPAGR